MIIISNLSACCNQQFDQHRTVWMGCKGMCSIEVRERWMKWRRVVLRVTYARANLVYSCLYQSQRIPSIAKTNISVFSKPGCGIGYEYWNQYTINHAGKAHQRIMAAIIWCLYIISNDMASMTKRGKEEARMKKTVAKGLPIWDDIVITRYMWMFHILCSSACHIPLSKIILINVRNVSKLNTIYRYQTIDKS